MLKDTLKAYCESNSSRSNFSERLYSKSKNLKESELCHWGILGMKWGVRRYQNKDGTLTDEGKKRYAKEQASEEYKEALKELRDAAKYIKAYGRDVSGRNLNYFSDKIKNKGKNRKTVHRDPTAYSNIYKNKNGEWVSEIMDFDSDVKIELKGNRLLSGGEEYPFFKSLTGKVDGKPMTVIWWEHPEEIFLGDRYRYTVLCDYDVYSVEDNQFGYDVYTEYRDAFAKSGEAYRKCRELGIDIKQLDKEITQEVLSGK